MFKDTPVFSKNCWKFHEFSIFYSRMTMYACARQKIRLLHDLPLAAIDVVAFIVMFKNDGIYVLRKASSMPFDWPWEFI